MTLSLTSPPPQAYFRQGVALQYLGRHADALAAFASGLAQDPKSLQLLVGMVEAAMKSPLRGKKFRNRRVRASECHCPPASPPPRVLSYNCSGACLWDNPHSLSVNECVGVTLAVSFLPARQAGRLSIRPSFCLCDWLPVSSTYLRTLRPDACSFSISYCQSGWSHTQISPYLNEHPALMPLSVSAPV